MFAYCGNNPVNGMDASGTRFVNTMMTDSGGGFIPAPCSANYTPDFVQYCQYHGYSFTEGYSRYYEGKRDDGKTFLLGFSLRGAFGISGNISIMLAFDTQGNIALYAGGGLGGGFPSASASFFGGYVSCPDATRLKGLTIATGGSAGEVFGLGGDYIVVIDNERNTTYHGVTKSFKTVWNYPLPVEWRCDTSYSFMVIGINIFNNVIRSDLSK